MHLFSCLNKNQKDNSPKEKTITALHPNVKTILNKELNNTQVTIIKQPSNYGNEGNRDNRNIQTERTKTHIERDINKL